MRDNHSHDRPEMDRPAPAAGAAPPEVRPLSDAARRALAEAEERRRAAQSQDPAHGTAAARPNEIGGRAGPDPVRYGDWEKGGIASDF